MLHPSFLHPMRLLLSFSFLMLSLSPLGLAEDRPNILLIMAEDMSARVGAFGDEVAVTPNLDKLAAKGTRYPNTFTTSGVCAPSRAAQILGVYQQSIGAHHMRTDQFKESPYRTVPPSYMKAYPELLRRQGYFTFNDNKLDFQFGTRQHGSGGPFTIWDVARSGASWKDRTIDQPFFGFITIFETHESKIFPQEVRKNDKNRAIPIIVNPEDVFVPPYYPDSKVVRKDIAQHYNNIHYMDKRVGEIISKLEADGEADNTIIIWTTDHGDGLPRSKREVYDSGIKVPLIIYWPERFRPRNHLPGGQSDSLISFVDLGPSILSLAGLTPPEHMHGSARFGTQKIKERTHIYAAKDRFDEHYFHERAVRTHKYKYIRNYQPGLPGGRHLIYRDKQDIMQDLWEHLAEGKLNSQQSIWFSPQPKESLYDVLEDPYEVNNLAGNPEYLSVLEDMRFALSDWMKGMPDMAENPEIDMAKLFWPNGIQPVTERPILSQREGVATAKNNTESASIGYKIENSPWKLYIGPTRIGSGKTATFKAIKYGWAESLEATIKMN